MRLGCDKGFSSRVQEYCLGDVGVSQHMQEIFESMSVAFWLPDIIRAPGPGPDHQEALATLFRHVKSDLGLVAPHRAFPARCTARFLLRAFPPEACSGTLRFKDITGSAATFRNVRFTVRASRARHPFHTVAAFRV